MSIEAFQRNHQRQAELVSASHYSRSLLDFFQNLPKGDKKEIKYQKKRFKKKKSESVMNKIDGLFTLLILIVFCGCNHKAASSATNIDLKSVENSSIIDLSPSINFDTKDELIVVDSLFLTETISLIKKSSKKWRIIYLVNHEDKLYLNTLQYRANKVQEYFISKGAGKFILKAELGLEYKTKYPKLKESNVILQMQ